MMRQKGSDDADEEFGEVSNTPGMGGDGDVGAGEIITGAGLSGSGRYELHMGGEQPSLLTAEEQEALQPKEIKVVNPWIHEATHKEYLESVKVSHTLATQVAVTAPALLFKYYFLIAGS